MDKERGCAAGGENVRINDHATCCQGQKPELNMGSVPPNPNIWEYNQKCASVEKDSHNNKNNGHKFEKMDGSYNYSKVNPKPNDQNTSVDCKKFDLTDWAIQRIETEPH